MTSPNDLIRRGDALERFDQNENLPTQTVRDAINAIPAAEAKLKRLVFNNADATPKTVVIECGAASIYNIMAWYGAYFAGDRYTVAFDGRNVPMDQNGEPI